MNHPATLLFLGKPVRILTPVAKLATHDLMKAVGTKVLKDNLSKYLKLVREGETILVTDRDEVIAEIHPPTYSFANNANRWALFLNEELRRGSVTRATTGHAPSLKELFKLPRPSRPVDLGALIEGIKAD